MTHLYLIRHGQSVSAVENTLGDRELSPLGVKQAERLRDRLAATGEIAADVLISSTLKRAQQTAQIIAPALGLPIILDDEVEEIREGEAAGLSEAEYIEKYGDTNFEIDPFRPVSPGGESWAQFMARVGSALYRITHEHAGKTIVVVCHGGIIDGSFIYFFGMPSLTLPQGRLYTRNTSITHWQHRPSPFRESEAYWHLLSYNDDFHVRDIDLPEPLPWKELFSGRTKSTQKPNVPLPSE